MANKKKKLRRFSNFIDNKLDYVLLVDILLLLALGVVMVLSASAPSSLVENGNSYLYFTKQAIFAVVGIGIMLFISKIDYRFYKKYYWLIYIASVAILLLVLVPGLGKSANGANRWIKIPGLRPISTIRIYKNRTYNMLCRLLNRP